MEVITADDAFNVRWSNHHRAIAELLDRLYNDEAYTDCSLAADGEEINAHKLILSACSPFLHNVLKKHVGRHPVIVLRDVSFEDLSAVVEYIYKGEVSLSQERLTSFLKAAEMLSVTGLTGVQYGTNRPRRSPPVASERKATKCYLAENVESKTAEDDDLSIMEEYLLEDGDVKEEEKENDNFQVFVVEEGGSMKELREVYNEEQPEEMDTDLESILTGALADDNNTMGLPPQLSSSRAARRKAYNIHCEKCGGLYKHESSFYNHLRHDCAQTHTCNTCDKTFKNKRHLLDHVRDDCGRVHHCPNCSRTFRQKVNLTTHQKHYCKPKKIKVSVDDIFNVTSRP